MGDEEAKPPDPPKASPKARGPALARMGSAYTKAGSKLLLSPQENKAGALLKKKDAGARVVRTHAECGREQAQQRAQ